MAKKSGRVGWIPKVVIDELEDIMQTEQVNVPSEAMHRMAKYSKKARTPQRRTGFNPPIADELANLSRPGRKKKKFVGGIFG